MFVLLGEGARAGFGEAGELRLGEEKLEMEGVLVLLFLGAIAATAYLIAENRAGIDTTTVQRSADEVIALAVTQIPGGTASLRSSWMPAGHTDRSAAFTYRRRRSILLALFLLAFFLIPGILYLVFGGKNQTLQVSVLPGGGSAGTTVQVASSGGVARRRARAFLRALTGGEQVAAGTAVTGRAPALASAGGSPAGWHDDPDDPDAYRYWDGSKWTEHRAPKAPGQSGDDRAGSAPALAGAAAEDTPAREAVEQAAAEAGSTGSSVFCEHCGAAMGADHRFCPSCGQQPTALA